MIRFTQKTKKPKSKTKCSKLLFSKKQLGILVIVIVIGFVGDAVALKVFKPSKTSSDENSLNTNPVIASTVSSTNYSSSSITASAIVAALNQSRASKDVANLNWINKLDNAATARANYMVANNTVSITAGDPGADLTGADYNYSIYEFSDTYYDTSVANVVYELTIAGNASFGYTTQFSDIGVAVVPDTIYGTATKLIVVYLANQQNSNSGSGSSSQQDNGSSDGLSAQQNAAKYDSPPPGASGYPGY
jgi:hypothetical protein